MYIFISKSAMEKNKLQLTSVKVHGHLFDEFKVMCVRTKFSLQKLTDRAMHLYLTDEEFRKQVHNHNNLNLEKKAAVSE
jgi:hypothetical protein